MTFAIGLRYNTGNKLVICAHIALGCFATVLSHSLFTYLMSCLSTSAIINNAAKKYAHVALLFITTLS